MIHKLIAKKSFLDLNFFGPKVSRIPQNTNWRFSDLRHTDSKLSLRVNIYFSKLTEGLKVSAGLR